MDPRFRKSAPDGKQFDSEEEMNKFISELTQKQAEQADKLNEELLPRGFQSVQRDNVPDAVAEALDDLLQRIEKFCPHINTVPPTIDHLLLPAIQVACCSMCLPDFMPLLHEQMKSTDCDLCGIISREFVEISIPIGYGLLTINVGEKCCADIFIR